MLARFELEITLCFEMYFICFNVTLKYSYISNNIKNQALKDVITQFGSKLKS